MLYVAILESALFLFKPAPIRRAYTLSWSLRASLHVFDQHTQLCNIGGFVNERHNNLIGFFTVLLNKVCNGVKAESHLTYLSGEVLSYKTAIDAMVMMQLEQTSMLGASALYGQVHAYH